MIIFDQEKMHRITAHSMHPKEQLEHHHFGLQSSIRGSSRGQLITVILHGEKWSAFRCFGQTFPIKQPHPGIDLFWCPIIDYPKVPLTAQEWRMKKTIKSKIEPRKDPIPKFLNFGQAKLLNFFLGYFLNDFFSPMKKKHSIRIKFLEEFSSYLELRKF